MRVKIRLWYFFIIIGSFCAHLHADTDCCLRRQGRHDHTLDSYLIPKHHPLREQLHHLFKHSHMFGSAESFTNAGFEVRFGHRDLMVGAYPSFPEYLFKKFADCRSQKMQLKNFIKRIEGAKVLRQYIEDHNFKHLVVPEKWLYKLPRRFSKKPKNKPAYILIVENMDIYDDWDDLNGEARNRYYNMDIEMLTELCTVLHDVGGCDGYPRNQPFTRSGKIAFVDTEHVGKLKGHFIKHIVPALNEELQVYALALWEKLEQEEQEKQLGSVQK